MKNLENKNSLNLLFILKSSFKKKDLIIEPHFRGGIGNQFYIYSAAKYLEKELNLNTKIYADVSSYKIIKVKYRSIEILNFLKRLGYKDKFIILKQKTYLYYFLLKIAKKSNFLKSIIQIILQSYIIMYESEIFQIKKKKLFFSKIILNGYFQSNEIIEKSKLVETLNYNRSLKKELAIHIRIGDYIKYPYNKIYNIVNEKYIKDSFEIFKEYKFRKVKVFSDSLEIAEKIVLSAIGEEVIIEKSTNTDANEDLLEISSYEFRILSNSTFSLFSHFLSQKGISVIPSNWFKNQETNSTLLKQAQEKIFYLK